ncbi:N-acetylneuraminate synthase [Bdellovibrio svalbardensis]|uniref:N-acetylneuraminate synthase n=1 Tax=Bdellovibrio svalbardensis TaxID=2972972 RepID=A0ABT6DQD0_9BACT|nr:N-acetylneuraminate synthase [Bdellovibrio svalbardensis]MDG0817353.1 N-acetylneuraminate synthase [Bdellovibrio svalbardensis]
MKNKVFIIAEAGVNHNGSFDLAIRLCDIAKEAGADAVKFQTFKTEKLLTKKAKLAEYQKNALGETSDGQFDMIKKLELSYDQFGAIKEHCEKIGIEFMSTPDDDDSLEFLVNLGIRRLKIGSAEITNVPFLRKFAKTGLPLIVSSGMADLIEVLAAKETLVKAGAKAEQLTFLHCNTEYPTPMRDVNLRAMLTMKEHLKTEIGYSDHTLGLTVCTAAAALGATVLEKHFTIDTSMEGPDHQASLTPQQLKDLVQAVRDVEICLGSDVKKASPSEEKNKAITRRLIVASRPIQKGEILSDENLTTKRAPTGISANQWDLVIGKKASKNYEEDESIFEH